MIPWADIVARQREQEQRLVEIEQNNWKPAESQPVVAMDRWQWRVMNSFGSWLVTVGCRLQTHALAARQMVQAQQAVVDANSQSARPCP